MPVDHIQKRLVNYAWGLNYEGLSPEAIHAAKVRVIDTLGALIGGFYGEPCRIARNLSAQMPDSGGATVIGTRMKTTPDMAAFVNGTTSRYVEMNDTYHGPRSHGGHPSDVITPVLAVSEHAQVTGKEFITGIVLAYEVYLRISDALHTRTGFDCTTFCCMGIALAAGRALGLSTNQFSHCISIAVVANNALNQGRTGHLSMWKAVAAGQAGRAGVFAALLAREGMEGPHLPFEGNSGWCNYVSRKRFSLDTMGGNGTPFKIHDTLIKKRACCATSVSTILAAEKVAPEIKNIKDVKHVTVETYERSKASCGSGDHHWSPDSRETADHSIPYGVAVALMEGTVTPRSFDDAHIRNPELRALIQKIEVIANAEFTEAYERLPVAHRSRVTVATNGGELLMGESGGDEDDLSAEMSDTEIEEKFHSLTEDFLGVKRVNSILNCLWNLEDLEDVAAIPPAFVLG